MEDDVEVVVLELPPREIEMALVEAIRITGGYAKSNVVRAAKRILELRGYMVGEETLEKALSEMVARGLVKRTVYKAGYKYEVVGRG